VPFELESAKHGLAAVAQELGSTFTVLAGSQARLAWSGQAHSHQQLREDLRSAGILKLSDDGSISEEQFSSSPDLSKALMDAIMDAFEAHQTMSSQALGSARVREGLRDILLGPAQLYEALRARAAELPSRTHFGSCIAREDRNAMDYGSEPAAVGGHACSSKCIPRNGRRLDSGVRKRHLEHQVPQRRQGAGARI
jgi:hypothetical protein